MIVGTQSLKVNFRRLNKKIEWLEIYLVFDKSVNITVFTAATMQSQQQNMCVAYQCEGCSAGSITQYKINEIKQELTKEKDYFGDDSDERLYIDMRHS